MDLDRAGHGGLVAAGGLGPAHHPSPLRNLPGGGGNPG